MIRGNNRQRTNYSIALIEKLDAAVERFWHIAKSYGYVRPHKILTMQIESQAH